ncbi:MAG: ORF6N domain-containing protein [Gammaproteobacteria bacterium]|nr:ORF6N domain-containing protein [Gammaproteobacteria bacterium]MCD8525229.1 ORF6N domain-containing protein [Gammaproteobacteria bacterium]MCD8541957.1 ORF6N domain-containing protein [Gammaproteobacteria bacterium]MCD8573881.1 ORF6N domain-containing protein [Gammaproteobacteria bacterium]
MQIVKYDQVTDKIIEVRQQKIIVDSDVADLYGVETKDINKAVKNNPEKFPEGYIFELLSNEKNELVENFHRFKRLKHSTALPKAFTERGLYMLATILKSSQAINTTIAIIDTFAKIKELTQTAYQFSKAKTDEQRVKIFENSTEIIADLLGNELTVSQHETSFKLKLPFLEISRKITKVKK